MKWLALVGFLGPWQQDKTLPLPQVLLIETIAYRTCIQQRPSFN